MENFRLRVFRAVAEEMSFRKAAEVLHLSQPAVSQHVHALEEEAGVQLFDRARGAGHGSQISLTEAGRVLLGYANAAAEMMVEAQRALAALNDEADGPLRLGASTTVAQYLLPRILGAFLKQYPQVKLSLVSGNTEQIVEAVAEKKVALGIIEGPAMRRDVKTERMAQDEMVLIVSPNHPWALRKGRAIEGAELAKAPLLLRERGSGSRRVVERALKKMGLPLRSLQVAVELDSTEAIISGVEAELGVGFVSLWALGKALRLGTVRVVAVKGLEMRRDFSFVRLAGAEITGAAAAFQRFAMGRVDPK
ncbi:LysR substrate-binding domain-containing protein [Tunturiibacter gelidoferens]|uniref:DNA-binding transcriptional LysR family regulator n=1 Tax=Tunturiibacter gelidiferens TaxID=3069689 RepID=A0ACC5P0G9_9BACT|nr:LysR substrate-binding domain-containing protein [Edaphobacter lichenicola]MBB5340351.1 DNA-binding transcriptional LysR family regulator [Edaphobacter lichenicola]